MVILLNILLATVGAGGIVWYNSSSTDFWVMLGYFIVLCTVGAVAAIAHYFRIRSLLLLALGLNGVMVGLLVALQVSAFVLSPGSGVAAAPFVVIPLAINAISMKWISAEVKQ